MSEVRIVESTLIEANPDRIWDLLTDPENLTRWWDSLESVTGEVSEGSGIVLDFGSHGRTHAVVEKLDVPKAFSFRWSSRSDDRPAAEDESTLVEFTLEPRDGGTFVQVTESGFEDLAGDEDFRTDLFEDRSGGWPTVLVWLSGSPLLSA